MLLVGFSAELQSHLRHRLATPQWSLREAFSGSEALEILGQRSSDLVLVAPSLPDLDATEFQHLVRSQFPGIQAVHLDGPPTQPRTAGASVLGELLRLHEASPAAMARAGRIAASGGTESGWQGILGSSGGMKRVFHTAALVARRETTVLIQGESGTGKDLLARAIHNSSRRAKQPFVVINCAAIPDTLLESELFGYAKGAFTGATQSRLGKVHAAHGGTLFLDEIGDMPLSLQSKILRFLEQGEVQRIGGGDTLKVDCRIVAATNADLQEHVRTRQFRQDLYYRLAVMPIAMPSLRERMDDLPALCASFLDRFCPGSFLHPEALALLSRHDWPGNVRELRNVMERASLFAEGRQEIRAEDIVL